MPTYRHAGAYPAAHAEWKSDAKTSCALSAPQRSVPSARALVCWELHGVGAEFHGGGGPTTERPPSRPRGTETRWKDLMRPEHAAVGPEGSAKLRANTVQLPSPECRPTRPRWGCEDSESDGKTSCALKTPHRPVPGTGIPGCDRFHARRGSTPGRSNAFPPAPQRPHACQAPRGGK